jgi:hypothetical protein
VYLCASIIGVTRIGELGTTFAVTSNRPTLRLALFLAHRLLSPWWWRRKFPPKRRFLQEPLSVRQLIVTANVVPISPILVMEALSSSEMSVLTRTIRRSIRQDVILNSHRRQNLKSCIDQHVCLFQYYVMLYYVFDCLCGLVIRLPGC